MENKIEELKLVKGHLDDEEFGRCVDLGTPRANEIIINKLNEIIKLLNELGKN